jgi:predicted  nucleic acid-binding Zn-ribbon protein
VTYKSCKICGAVFASQDLEEGICHNCQICGAVFASQDLEEGICHNCQIEKRRQIWEIKEQSQ